MEGNAVGRIGPTSTSCQAGDGSQAGLERDQGRERLVVRDARQRLLFAYEPASGRCVISVPTGDLVLRAPDGRIELEAADGVRVRSEATVEVDADLVRTRVRRAEVQLEEGQVEAAVLTTSFRRLRQTVDVLELKAGRVVERAKESYRDIEGLAQTRAGRIRQVSEQAVHLLGRRLLLRAERDVKLDGDKIHLG